MIGDVHPLGCNFHQGIECVLFSLVAHTVGAE